MAQTIARFEEVLKNNISDINEKVAALSGKQNSSKINEAKIEQLVDRHNQTLQNFEVKMNQMQKIMSEQQMQIINYKSLLDQSHKELARLKRV